MAAHWSAVLAYALAAFGCARSAREHTASAPTTPETRAALGAAGGVSRAAASDDPRAFRVVPLGPMRGDVEILFGHPDSAGRPFVMRVRELPGTIVQYEIEGADGTLFMASEDGLRRHRAAAVSGAPSGMTRHDDRRAGRESGKEPRLRRPLATERAHLAVTPREHQRRSAVSTPAGLMILIAGPYRSGTGDDPAKMAANVRVMEWYALPLFRAGHVPIVGEWLALPLVALAGSRRVGDEAFDEIFHPIAERLLERCDAVLRVGGASQGADQMVHIARARGLAVFHGLNEVPGCAEAGA